MSLFAAIGFVAFFIAAWLRLKQLGADKWGWNPYMGPPPLMTCMVVGFAGAVLGAVVSIFKKRN